MGSWRHGKIGAVPERTGPILLFCAPLLDLVPNCADNNEVALGSQDLPAKETPMPSKPETRIQELHLMLPEPPKPMAKYKSAVLAGNMLYISGHGPAKIDARSPVAGKVGADLTPEQGKE